MTQQDPDRVPAKISHREYDVQFEEPDESKELETVHAQA